LVEGSVSSQKNVVSRVCDACAGSGKGQRMQKQVQPLARGNIARDGDELRDLATRAARFLRTPALNDFTRSLPVKGLLLGLLLICLRRVVRPLAN
jgi:hypothetical protein